MRVSAITLKNFSLHKNSKQKKDRTINTKTTNTKYKIFTLDLLRSVVSIEGFVAPTFCITRIQRILFWHAH